MTLQVHRAERADVLAHALAEVLAVPPDDVFAEEVVAVPARGVERWLTQQLSHRLGRQNGREDGVCAGVRFPSPAAMIAEVVGVEGDDAWAPDRLVWPLLEVIDESVGESWCRTLGVHLGVQPGAGADDGPPGRRAVIDQQGDAARRPGGAGGAADDGTHRRGRRYAVARRLAGLFDSYASHRPDMLSAWAAGDDTDGFGDRLPTDLAWQAQLWRLVAARVGGDHPVQRLAAALQRLAADPAALRLPPRLSLFGPTRLSTSQLQVLVGLAADRDVHLWLPHPSPVLWERVAPLAATGSVRRRLDPTSAVPQHPLLSSLGRDARELQLTLAAAAAGMYDDQHHPLADQPMTLLQLLQRDLRDDRRPERGGQNHACPEHGVVNDSGRDDGNPDHGNPDHGNPDHGNPDHGNADHGKPEHGVMDHSGRADGDPDHGNLDRGGPTIAPEDRSVQVHACHGPARQVDVLREVLVSLLADDPTLEPRDVLVMCPDIEVYAPLISAAFGLADVVDGGHPAHELRVRLADRALTQTNPLLATVTRLLELADGRVTASQVLDLAAWPPVRRRFGFDDDDIEQLARWVAQSGVRWGLDATHRSPYGLAAFPQNTWRAGLDRVLLGVAMADEEQAWLGLALPLDDVGSSDVELAGQLAELLDRLETALDALTGEQPLDHWIEALLAGVDSLTRVPRADYWQVAELHRELRGVVDDADHRAATTTLGLADLRALLGGRLGGRPTRANFRTGTLTVCTMVPMRSVPHRVMCLLGLDDGIFPRGARIDGDDVLARDPAVGERDPRGEDRQLMLDAILAATEHLVVTYTGADERTGAVRPPAVPLGELLDALDDTARTASGGPARDQVLVRHPLQLFDARNVTPGALGAPGPFSFDTVALAGARAAAAPRVAPPPFLAAPLPALAAADVELGNLLSFLRNPAGGFLRQRLDVALRYEEDEASDNLAVELDNLELWAVGDRLLAARLGGASEEACRQVEWRRGVLPPGPLGARSLDQVLAEVAPLVDRTTALRAAPARTVDLVVGLHGGRELRGSVAGVHEDCAVSIGYSRLGPAARLRAWVNVLALSAAHPDASWTAAAVGRGSGGPRQAAYGPVDADAARKLLVELVDLYDRGLREPLPLAVKTSAAYAAARRDGSDPAHAERKAAQQWATGSYPGEDASAAHVQVWGPGTRLQVLLQRAPSSDERWAGEPTRFGELALRLWSPLLDHERMTGL